MDERKEKAQLFKHNTKKLMDSIGKDEMNRLFRWEYCELEFDFLGFIDNYMDIPEFVPKDFTIIDIGCYQACQGAYYKDYKNYIGVEPCVPIEYRLRQDNAIYYQTVAQSFVKNELPKLLDNGHDLQKIFVICSAVPDKEVWNIIQNTFPYYRIAYPSKEDFVIEKLPKEYKKSCYMTENNQYEDR